MLSDFELVQDLYLFVEGIGVVPALAFQLPFRLKRGFVVLGDSLYFLVFLLCYPLDNFLLLSDGPQLAIDGGLFLLMLVLNGLCLCSKPL